MFLHGCGFLWMISRILQQHKTKDEGERKMGLRKKYLKSRPVCKVTFTVPKALANSAQKIHLVGEFNQWNITKTPLKKTSRGYFSTTIDLDKGKEYQFRYLIDDNNWINDPRADRYVYNDYANCENSVVEV